MFKNNVSSEDINALITFEFTCFGPTMREFWEWSYSVKIFLSWFKISSLKSVVRDVLIQYHLYLKLLEWDDEISGSTKNNKYRT